MPVPHFRYQFKPCGSSRWDRGYTHLNDADLPDNGGTWLNLIRAAGRPVQSWAHDLRETARAVYLADRCSPRRHGAFDGWTRRIELRIAVRDATAWNAVTQTLQHMLNLLTADTWAISFTPRAEPYAAPATLDTDTPVTEVTTFSGGLDSTAHVVERARERTDGAVMLIAFYHGLLRQQQQKTRDQISRQDGRPLVLGRIHQIPRGGKQRDPTQRTRGFVYAAATIFAAAGHGLTEASLPENGVMAINSPLTPSRLAACSTRSVHPTVLALLNELIAGVGGTVTVVNPYSTLTKGEVCRRAVESGAEPAQLWDTISCGHPHRQALTNCGHCYPCLVRRSGLHAALGRDDTVYAQSLDAIDINSGRQSARDLRGVLIWLNRNPTIDDILSDVPLPPDVTASAVMQLEDRARREMADMIKAVRPDLGELLDAARQTTDRPAFQDE